MSASGLGRFKTFRQKRVKLRETVNELFFDCDYARIAIDHFRNQLITTGYPLRSGPRSPIRSAPAQSRAWRGARNFLAATTLIGALYWIKL